RATDVELDHSTYKLFPPRSAGLGIGVASDIKGSWEDLPDDQKAIVELDYFKGDDSVDRLENKLEEYDDTETTVAAYLEDEHTATAYATQVAQAIWGDVVWRVQFKAARQNVVPCSDRKDKSAERPNFQPVLVGWLALVVDDHQSQEEFTKYFCSSDQV